MSLTGPLAGNGKAALISMQIWAEDLNAKGGLLGRKVELVYYDDQTNPSTVPSIYTKLLDVDKVELIVRSEERRVGKECRSRWWPDDYKKRKEAEKFG